MANYPPELAQDAVCQSHTGHMTGLWFMPARPLRLNINERMNEYFSPPHQKKSRRLRGNVESYGAASQTVHM